jgi:hypothetical protein
LACQGLKGEPRLGEKTILGAGNHHGVKAALEFFPLAGSDPLAQGQTKSTTEMGTDVLQTGTNKTTGLHPSPRLTAGCLQAGHGVLIDTRKIGPTRGRTPKCTGPGHGGLHTLGIELARKVIVPRIQGMQNRHRNRRGTHGKTGRCLKQGDRKIDAIRTMRGARQGTCHADPCESAPDDGHRAYKRTTKPVRGPRILAI